MSRTRALALLLALWPATSLHLSCLPGRAQAPLPAEGSASGGSGPNSIGMSFVRIAAGSFQMGSPLSEEARRDDEPQHQVTLTKSFMMSTTEVTQGQWQAVMGSNPSHFSSCGAGCPVERVGWHDAVKFANALSKMEGLRPAYQGSDGTVSWDKSANGYRLPTEAEWEYAARGGQGHVYSGSNSLSAVGWTAENSDLKTHNVAGKRANAWDGKTHKVAGKRANAWGLYDMSGNVWEWCWDWYGGFSGGYEGVRPSRAADRAKAKMMAKRKVYPSTDPVGAQSGDFRVGRGGSWIDRPASARVAARYYSPPGSREFMGLRLVRTNP